MILVNSNQKGNNVLEYLSKNRWIYDDSLLTDYLLNNKTSVLFLCCRFHVAKPEYIHKRLRKLRNIDFQMKVLLILIDVQNYDNLLYEFFCIGYKNDHTVLFVFSDEEASRFLIGFESIKNNSATFIKGKIEDDAEAFLKATKSITKRDIDVMKEKCKNLKEFINMSETDMIALFGIGERKIDKLQKYFEMDFSDG